MAVLQIDQLRPDMVLGSDVKDRSGRLLAGKGMTLTAQHFTVFKTWGIKSVEIAEEGMIAASIDEDEKNSVSEDKLRAAVEKLRPFFCLVDLEHPFYQELLRLAAIRQTGENHDHH